MFLGETSMTSHVANYPNQPASSEEMLDALQRDAFGYFLHETNPANGLVADKTQPNAPASIAAVGFALAAYPVGVERYQWKEIYGHEFLYGSSLFIHQFSHLWIDFRGIQDAFMRDKGIDYFENSRRATHVQQHYAIDNPHGFVGYGQYFWGLTASDGPGRMDKQIARVKRRFFDYVACGVLDGPDDGTVAPWAVAASLPFAPEIVLPTVRYFKEVYPEITGKYCFKCSFSVTFPHGSPDKPGRTSRYHYGINLGPVVLACENHRSGLLWRLTRRGPHVITGLRRAGFANGWL
jgi:hypothetical protein